MKLVELGMLLNHRWISDEKPVVLHPRPLVIGLKSEDLRRAASSRLRSGWASPNIGDSGRLTNAPVSVSI